MTKAITDQGYDFIIVGSGSAGSVMAERLSENGRHRVLLLEQGPGDSWISRMPKGYGMLVGDPHRASFFPIQHDAASLYPAETWVRGKMLGGSSAINGMVWIRSGREDYDRLEEMGISGWNWDTMLPYLRKLEDHQLGANEYRGAGGPVEINTNPYSNRLADAFVAAGTEKGLPFKADQNGPELEGVGYAQWNIDRSGRRVSSARAFLKKAAQRRNLTVHTHVTVERVMIEGRRAIGVSATRGGHPVEYRARREVILCAGALASPKLLELSGIGDGEVLRAAGVSVVHHSPNVGKQMHEHLTLPLNFRLREWRDSQNREFGGWRLFRNIARYMASGTGPMAIGAAEAIAFIRANPASKRADTQIMFNPYTVEKGPKGQIGFEKEPGMQCYSYLLRPTSKGSVHITSNDPAAPLSINANYLGTDDDRANAIAGTRAMRDIVAAEAFGSLVVGETEETRDAKSDDEILGLYRKHGQSGYHAVGTAAMGPGHDAVVDHRLRVRGVEGMRVMDCSVFPEIPSGNTNAPTMAASWRASDLIQEDNR
ncbi:MULTISPECIES: FAD-dependent oxidoreductase [unclassified Sphingomonas]|uniref:GMC family oxidoreductase n=1 Tax=unclassified Sphingomonas TaxID=196159 RepID=UPI00226A3E80|nr:MULTISPECIES: FAD-dependent oxidoreductase [unclassified Sphingomonas]